MGSGALDTRYEKCEDSNAVKSFCDCISGEESVDVASKAICKRATHSNGHVTGDELVELKKALKDLEETDPDEQQGGDYDQGIGFFLLRGVRHGGRHRGGRLLEGRHRLCRGLGLLGFQRFCDDDPAFSR